MSRMFAPMLGGLLLFCTAGRLPAQDWADKMFEKMNLDMGVTAKGADVKYRVSLTNKYLETIHISNVSTTCGCFSAKTQRNALQSGESTEIEINVDTRRYERNREATLIVALNGQSNNGQPFSAEVRLPMRIYIRTDVVLTPGGVEFGSVPKGQSAERKVTIAYAGRQNWTIKDVVCKNPNLDVKVTEKGRQPGGRVDYEMTVLLKPDVPVGELRDQIQLVTDDINNPYVPVVLTGRVEAEFTVNPEVLAFGTLAPGEKKTVNVVVRGRKPFVIDKIESDKTAGVFQVRLPQEAKAVHVLPITVTAPSDGATLDDTFSITIEGAGEAVTFRATGKVTGSSTTQVKTPTTGPQ